MGHQVIGIRRGWEGLTHVQPELPDGGGSGYVRRLDRINTRTIERTGGTSHWALLSPDPGVGPSRGAFARSSAM
jgi:6-phosphofructokinase